MFRGPALPPHGNRRGISSEVNPARPNASYVPGDPAVRSSPPESRAERPGRGPPRGAAQPAGSSRGAAGREAAAAAPARPGRAAAHLRAPANGRNGSNGSSLSPRGSSAGTRPMWQMPGPRRPPRPRREATGCLTILPPIPASGRRPGQGEAAGACPPLRCHRPATQAGAGAASATPRSSPRPSPARPPRRAALTPPAARLHSPGRRRRRQPPPAPQHGAARLPAPPRSQWAGAPPAPFHSPPARPSPAGRGAPFHWTTPSAFGPLPPMGVAEGAPPPAGQWAASVD